MKPTDGFYASIKEHIDSQWRQDYFKVCDLILDAYLMGISEGMSIDPFSEGAVPAIEALTPLVEEVGLDPKVVLRRLYCPQQTEDNGECTCE